MSRVCAASRCRGTVGLQQLQVALVARRQLGAETRASVRAACAVAVRPRISSNTSGLRFCGMIEEPVVKASGSSTKAEFLGVEEQHVGGEAAEVLHEERDLEQQAAPPPCRARAAPRSPARGLRRSRAWRESRSGRSATPACRTRPPTPTAIYRSDAGPASSPARRRGSPPQTRPPTAQPSSASPAACAYSPAAPFLLSRSANRSSAAATPSAPRPIPRRHPADTVAGPSAPDRCASVPRWTRPPAAPMRSVSLRLERRLAILVASSICHRPRACSAASAVSPLRIASRSAAARSCCSCSISACAMEARTS